MRTGLLRSLAGIGVFAGLVFVVCTMDAQAGWRSFHSSGGSSGSWGGYGSSSSSSSGGYSSSSSSSGGYGLFRRWRHHRAAWRHHHHSWGSSGSSSSSSSGYHAGWGSSSSSSSSSGGYYSTPYAAPNAVPYAAPTEPAEGAPAPPAELPPQARADSGVLSVSVPANAVVFVNGKQTTSTGNLRQYVSRGLESGYKYTYEVRVAIECDGETIEETKMIDLRAGSVASLDFDFAADLQVATTLKLNVPENARVTLSGAKTSATGTQRSYTTMQLKAGESWTDYTIHVEFERDGRTLSQERDITLNAGDSQELTFDFNEVKVASR